MKLIFCRHCHDVVALRKLERTCECGASSGVYIDPVTARISGPCVSLAIGNGSLRDAIQHLATLPPDRAFYPVMCWVRPNYGPMNPHTVHTE